MLGVALVLSAVVALQPGAAPGQNERVWHVEKKLVGEDIKKSTKIKNVKKSTDISGIACTSDTGFPRSCLVIDDNLRSAQFVKVKNGEIVAGSTIRLIDDEHELDGEGVAYGNGFFYVLGSHGHPRDRRGELHPGRNAAEIRAKIAASSQLIRIRVDSVSGQPPTATPELARTSKLKEIIRESALAPFVDRRLEDNGVTIEGVAIHGNRLFAGFRGPLVNNRAVILSVSLGALFEAQPPDAELHLLTVGPGRGVRDLARFADGLLVLAGPMADNNDAGYAIYWWDRVNDTPSLLKVLPTYPDEDGNELKPEAILPLDQTSTNLRLLLMFDGAKEGGPRAIEVAKPPRP